MPGYRKDRINDAVRECLAKAVGDIKDPRVCGSLVSITAARVAGDLKTAKIYFSVMSDDVKEIKAGLVSAKGFLRRRLAEEVNLRITPDLSFEYDKSIEHGAHISKLLAEIEKKDSGSRSGN